MTLVFCLLCERKFTYSMLRKLENSKYNENHNIKILFITSIYGENLYLLKFKKEIILKNIGIYSIKNNLLNWFLSILPLLILDYTQYYLIIIVMEILIFWY